MTGWIELHVAHLVAYLAFEWAMGKTEFGSTLGLFQKIFTAPFVAKDEPMNFELKSLVKLVLDLYDGLEDVEHNKSIFVTAPEFFRILGDDLPTVVHHANHFLAEIKELPGTAQEDDLTKYIQSRFAQSVTSNKANLILANVIQLIEHLLADVLTLQKSINS